VHRGRLGGIRSYNAVSRERVTVFVLGRKHIKGMLRAKVRCLDEGLAGYEAA
jgi:hypothetical protein